MEIRTVSLFGHRIMSDPSAIYKALTKEVEDLIRSNEYVEFLVGRSGDFDIMAASVIRAVRDKLDYGNCSMVLVLPNMTKEYRDNKASFESYYDSVEICDKAAAAHFKAHLQVRNREMVDRSDLVICCVERKDGGAYQAMKYAENRKIEVRNLTDF